MENNNNIEDERMITRISKGKPPTRLQKHAPAALQLGDALVKRETSFSRCAIPLLSPLLPSPDPLLPEPAESIMTTTDVQAAGNATGLGLGWQHPAVAPGTVLPDPSSMFDLFQMQCTLVQHSQS